MEMWLVSKPNVSNSTLQLSLNGSVFRGGRTVTCSSEGRLARLEKDGSQDVKNEGLQSGYIVGAKKPTGPALRHTSICQCHSVLGGGRM